MTASESILTNIEAPVGWVTIHRPESRGALTRAMWLELPEILRSTASAPGVRVVVVRGSEGSFAAGADISEFEELRSDPARAAEYDRGAESTLLALENLKVPSIAMIDGPCIGGGCLIAFACDLRIAADDARLGIPAGRLGLAYPYAGIERLVAVLGEAEALALTLTGRLYSGSEAFERGLVQYRATRAELESATRTLAAEIAANAPLALRYLRLAVRRRNPASLDEQTARALADACFESEDYQEGIAAFLAKRRPMFRGR